MSLGTLILTLTVLFIRNTAGLVILLAAIAAAVGLILSVPQAFSGHLVAALGLALLVGSIRDLLNLESVHVRHRDRLDTPDAFLLSRRTSMPSSVADPLRRGDRRVLAPRLEHRRDGSRRNTGREPMFRIDTLGIG
jgi:hypothetical protein